MEVLLIRHAIPIRRELESGIADPELANDGLKQADLMAQYLASEKLHAIYASPMQRAQQTAQPLASVQGLSITTVEGVAEYDKNSNQYVPVEELKAKNDPRWQEMLRGEWTQLMKPKMSSSSELSIQLKKSSPTTRRSEWQLCVTVASLTPIFVMFWGSKTNADSSTPTTHRFIELLQQVAVSEALSR